MKLRQLGLYKKLGTVALTSFWVFSGGLVSGSLAFGASKNPTIDLKNGQGEKVGVAKLFAEKEGLRIALEVKNLKPGPHGIHLHENGKCEGPDFKSAGAHYNPSKKQHGLENPQGPHLGDLPNLEVGPDGIVKGEVFAKGVKLGATPRALVIHETVDDQKSDPAGNSGGRIVCGVLKK